MKAARSQPPRACQRIASHSVSVQKNQKPHSRMMSLRKALTAGIASTTRQAQRVTSGERWRTQSTINALVPAKNKPHQR
ncbi:hypothetical protein [Pseudomonas helmanticensis]|uniref:hypothetical protein n=1 Tax=Pseudomonas helmanticensis TaxID=1471381 RepID=UPI001FCAF430|nr:hypothetical protein [Pseudomonas helmanticensis]